MHTPQSQLRFSVHARHRCQQRSINTFVLDAVLDFGEWFHDHAGSMTAYLTRRSLRHLSPSHRKFVESFIGVAVTIAPDGTVITVQRSPHIKRNWRGGR